MRNSIFIKIQIVPLLQEVEDRNRVGEPHLEIRPHSLPQMFQLAYLRKQRKDGFNQHSVVPLAARANLQICGLIISAPKTFVSQHNHLLADALTERQKGLVANIRRLNLPINNQTEFIDQQAEFRADNPSPARVTFPTDAWSVRVMAFTNRVTQFDAVRINYAEHSRFSKKFFRQLAVCFQSPEKSGAFGQSGKQVNPILFYPTIKSVLRYSLESHQQTQSNQSAFAKFSLIMLRFVQQHIIYTAKKFYDKVFFGSRFSFPFVFGLVTFTLETFP